MTGRKRKTAALGAGALVLATMMAAQAGATTGYFALGFGPVQRGQGGAGVAYGTDAMSSTVNPAGVAHVGNEFSLGIQLFAPFREYTGTNTALPAAGTVKSGHNYFLVPNFAINKVLSNGARLNFTAYGNGGMNTSYPAVQNNACGMLNGTGQPGYGIFCDGKAGVNLNQLFLSLTYADSIGNLSWGIAPTIAAQQFSARGIGLFAGPPFYLSSDPAHFTSSKSDMSYGVGLRAGVELKASDTLQVGASLQTKFKMSKFKDYAGLFANGGAFDIPATATIGAAYKVTPDVTLLVDYEHIWYSRVKSIANPFPNGFTAAGGFVPFGSANGPGFGWSDVNVIKVGAVWKSSPQMTWRVGYAYSTNPVSSDQVLLNIFAPGVVKSDFTAGGSYALSDRDTIDFAFEYVPSNSVTGTLPAAFQSAGLPAGPVQIKMHQYSVSVGWTHKF